jgi:cytochrome b
MPNTVRVWDLPTRLFHWTLVLGVTALMTTGYMGGGALVWHGRLGYAILALLLFRIVWGFVGGHWSRFRTFIYSPASVIAYLRGKADPDHRVGHNPLGAGAVLAMLLVLLAQVGTGLIGDDEISFTGPLNHLVASSTGLAATWYHKAVGTWTLIVLVSLHVCAILYYLWKRDNLIRPMLSGDKSVAHGPASSRDDWISRLTALVVLGLSAGLVTWLVGLRAAG